MPEGKAGHKSEVREVRRTLVPSLDTETGVNVNELGTTTVAAPYPFDLDAVAPPYPFDLNPKP